MLTPSRLLGPIRSSISWSWNANEDQLAHSSSFARSAISALHLEEYINFKTCFDLAHADIHDGSSSTSNSLNSLFIKHGCNKGLAHNYPSLYNELFKPVSSQIELFVEIGIGSPYQDGLSRMHQDYAFGSSLRGWSDYLPNASVIGCDIDPRVLISEGKISSYYVDQLSPGSLIGLSGRIDALNGADVILDDGLHEHRASMPTILLLWPSLKSGGVYLIEDMSEDNFKRNLDFLCSINLGGTVFGAELESNLKDDNRVIAVIKD